MYKEALRQVWVEIDMAAFDYNVKSIRKQLGDKVEMIGVIKANGYGHGATECAKVLAYNGCDTYAVATLEEAVNLREDGIGGNIIVLGLTPSACFDVIVEYGVTPVMMSLENLKLLAKAAEEAKANGTYGTASNNENYEQKYMFALDTGMGRIGYRVYTDEDRKFACQRFVAMQEQVKELKVFGVMTHFSTADEEQRDYTGSQIANYKAFYQMIEDAGYTPKKICANSAAIMVYPEVHFDAARPGIILYGMYPSGYLQDKVIDLKPVMSVKAEIINLQDVPAGQSVSYGRKFTSNRESKLAVIGLGYADGFTRLYSGKAQVLVGGKRCPVVGNICMDQCMVDVTDVPGVQYGDEVVIIGSQAGETITAEDFAAMTGTINYEVTCLLDLRLPKVYKNYPEGMCK